MGKSFELEESILSLKERVVQTLKKHIKDYSIDDSTDIYRFEFWYPYGEKKIFTDDEIQYIRNNKEFFKECVDTVLQETYVEMESVVVESILSFLSL